MSIMRARTRARLGDCPGQSPGSPGQSPGSPGQSPGSPGQSPGQSLEAAGARARLAAARARLAGDRCLRADAPADVVVGVDTHGETHTAAFADGRGAVLLVIRASTDTAGLSELIETLAEVVDGLAAPRVLWAVQGAGSYGAGLRQTLQLIGFDDVVEVASAPLPRGVGKNDENDAIAIARAALRQRDSADLAERATQPRQGYLRQVLAARVTARNKLVAHRTALTNVFCALLVTGPVELRERLRGKTRSEQLAAVRRMRPRQVPLPRPPRQPAQDATVHDAVQDATVHDAVQDATAHDAVQDATAWDATAWEELQAQGRGYALAENVAVLAAVAGTIAHLDETIKQFDAAISKIVKVWAGPLLAEFGVGPIVAATILIAYSHHGRIRSEAAFAALAGVAPLEASSGSTTRYRLNRGGDRQLNAALHRIVLTRRAHGHQATLDYLARRTQEDKPKTGKEAVRCLKRHVARKMFRICRALPRIP